MPFSGASVLSKHLSYESDIFMQASLLAVGNRNTRSFLTAMLQRKQTKERELCCVVLCGRDSQHTTLFVRRVGIKNCLH